jgi:hypothetical protein
MEKPIVFLSHSSRNKAELIKLKALLDDCAAGSLEFFLSSDGESIRLGANWVVRISDALDKAKLLFVFLSPEAASSKWVHFEAGHAYAKHIQVVPVCLPGMDLGRMTPPLSLLQGFNLHHSGALSNIARVCNEVFKLRIREAFTNQEFSNVFAASLVRQQGFFGSFTPTIERISVQATKEITAGDGSDLLERLDEICKAASLHCHRYEVLRQNEVKPVRNLEMNGCNVASSVNQRKEQPPLFVVESTLSAGLFDVCAQVLDRWHKEYGISENQRSVFFRPEITGETVRYELTTKLVQSEIKMVDRHTFDFKGLVFSLDIPQVNSYGRTALAPKCCLRFGTKDGLRDERLSSLVERLFALGVLFEGSVTTEPFQLVGY